MRFAVFVFSILLIFSTTYAHAFAFVPAVVGGLVRTAGGQVMKVASKRGVVATASAALALYCKKNQKKCKDIVGEASDYFFDDELWMTNSICSTIATTKELSCQKAAKLYHDPKLRYNEKFNTCSSTNDRSHGLHFYFSNDVVHCKSEINQNNEQLAKKIAEKLSDDDIDQIINNYSKEIEINIDKYCATAGACAELEQSFGDEVMNNKSKYDIDKINKDNCELRDGKITSCDKAKKDTDDDDSDTPKEPRKPDDGDDGQDGQDGQDDDSDDTKPKDKPINCEASAFHKKVCDFIDWYQSDDYEKTDNKINIQDDTPKPTNTNIEFTGSCPASYVVSHTLHFGMLGSYDFEFTLLDTPKLCTFLNDWIKPIMMFLGPLHATYIIGKRDD